MTDVIHEKFPVSTAHPPGLDGWRQADCPSALREWYTSASTWDSGPLTAYSLLSVTSDARAYWELWITVFELQQSRSRAHLPTQADVDRVLADFGMSEAEPVPTPTLVGMAVYRLEVKLAKGD